jgi:hypothetical protein
VSGRDLNSTAQVQLMSQIYSKAATVINWLGEPKESFVACTQLRFQEHTPQWLSDSDWCSEYIQSSDKHRKEVLKVWSVILEMTHQEYWISRWIIQEITMANQLLLMYGYVEISWPVFCCE